MSDLPACEVCGARSFQKFSGFYVCTDCNTQSQEVQEHLFDYDVNLRREDDEDREEITIRESDKDRSLTSWEMYNLSLKRIVGELIALGASPELKVVAFQVWASYLQKANVAFYSKKEDKIPVLPLGFKSSDVEILYGVPNFKKEFFKDLNVCGKRKKGDVESKPLNVEVRSTSSDSSSSSDMNVSLRSLRKKQRKLAKTELDNSSVQNESLSHNESLHSLTSDRLRKKFRQKAVTFKSNTQRILKNMLIAAKKANPLGKEDVLFKKVKGAIHKRLSDSKKKPGAVKDMTITFTTVITVIRIALLLLGDDILLGDIMRWIGEGRISYNLDNISHEKLKSQCRGEFNIKLCNRTGYQLDIQNFTEGLGFNTIPTPDLYKLVGRYCQELCLPSEFVSYVHGIMNVFEPKMDYAEYDYRVFPDYERRISAYILFAFKLLFSLDGVTERKQSEFADHVNELHPTNPELPFLFSWNSWVQYIQCRKAILSKYNPAMNNFAYKGRVDNTNFFINQWDKLKRTLAPRSYPINEMLLSNTTRALQKFTIENDPQLEVKFPASLTPQSTCVTHLLDNYPHLVDQATRTILENKLTDYSILHLLDNNRCREIATMCNATVEFVDGIAEVDFKHYEPSEDSKTFDISKSTTVPAYAPTRCDVIPSKPEQNKRQPNPLKHKCKTFEFTFETFTDPEPPTESANTFKIYKPASNYWFFHEVGRRTTNEMFLELAEENLSESFLWLLKELANMLTGDCRDLYMDLVTIEATLYSLLEDGEFVDGCPIKLFPGEW